MIKYIRSLLSSSSPDAYKELNRLYEVNKEPFIGYILKRYSVDKDTVIDIYQESFIVLYQDIQSGKLQNLRSATLKTYLFSIGKNKVLKYLDKQNRSQDILENDFLYFIQMEDSSLDEEKQDIIRETVHSMDSLCKQVLTLFYWEEFSMHKIAQEMNYKSEQAAKNRKHICMTKLKKILEEIFRQKGLI